LDNQNHTNPVVNALLQHRSTPAGFLAEPAPQGAALQTILQCGLSAPDHASLTPWRFITIEGEARQRLGDAFVVAKRQEEPDFSDAKADGLRQKPLRAPLIIAVAARVAEHPKTPRIEQLLSAGVAAQHMQLAASALGFGSVWLTGPMARHPHIKQSLELAPEDELVGFLYMGTAKKPAPPKDRPAVSEHHQVWQG